MTIKTRRQPELNRTVSSVTDDKKINRAEQIRRDTDTVIVPSSELEKIDTTFRDFIVNVINPEILINDELKKVPVIYVDSEKWSNYQNHAYVRDAKNKANPPIIVWRRNDIVRREELRKPVANKEELNMLWRVKNKYSSQSRYMKFSDYRDKTVKPVEYYGIVFPDFITINYDVIVWTTHISHSNKIVESFIYHDGEAQGKEYKFHLFLDNSNLETTNATGEDRLVRANLSLHLDCYIIPEDTGNRPNLQKFLSNKKVVISEKEINDQNITDFNKKIK